MDASAKLGLVIIFISSFLYAKQQNVIPQNGTFTEEMNFTLNSCVSHSVLFNPPKSNVSYNIEAWTTTDSTVPVQVVVEEHENVIIWEVLPTNKTSRPLCSRHLWSNDSIKDYTFTVSLSTTSSSNISFYLNVIEKELLVKTNGPTNGTYHFSMSPDQPYCYLYNKTQKAVVTIDVQTERDNCMNVFIQENQCPLWYLNGTVFADSFQTQIETSALLTIRKNQIGDFFIIFVDEANEQRCKTKDLRDQLKRNVTVIISKEVRDPTWPVVTICALILAFFICCALAEWRLCPKRDVTQNGNQENVIPPGPQQNHDQQNSTSAESQQTDDPQNDDHEHLIPAGSHDQVNLVSLETQHIGTQANFIPKELYRKYASTTIITGIYYAIPGMQLVATKLIQSYSGEVDICYYNRRCANPIGPFADFNHILSNIGYIPVGILFLLITAAYDKNRNGSTKSFIRFFFTGDTSMPLKHDYDIYYALGWATIGEAIFSASYHVCPNNTDFQFDATFMYLIVILSMASLYQKRHRDKVLSVFWIFFWLAVILGYALGGLLDVFNSVIYIIIAISYECVVLGFSVYYGYSHRGQQQTRTHSAYEILFTDTYLIVVNVVTTVLLVAMGYLLVNNVLDFASIVLIMLIATCFLYMFYFIIKKKWFRQEPVQKRVYVYLTFSLVFWAGAFYCYFHNNMDWKLTPAESNLKNIECIVMNFFDYHDLWHLLSAAALHFTFMFLLVIDDGVRNTPHIENNVF